MSQIANQEYLRGQQYNTDANLQARIVLHQRFSTNPRSWMGWLFEQVDAPADARILELGCGPGHLWSQNIEQVPAGWDVTLTDFSAGMLAAARQSLGEHAARFRFAEVDAQNIPFDDGAFDVVIANFMLYHVPDRPKALREIRRVLRPGGLFFAATVGANHLREMRALAEAVDSNLANWGGTPTQSFLLENGAAQIEPFFDTVSLTRYPDGLLVTEAAPLAAHILSSVPDQELAHRFEAALLASLQAKIDADGPIKITKDSGIFRAVRGAGS